MNQISTLLLAATLCGAGAQVFAGDARIPEAKAVQASVAAALATMPHYQAGDLITQKSIAAATEHVAKQTGWRLAPKDVESLVKRGVEDRSFLAQKLSTKQGRAFSRQIAKYRLGFDQLDQLSTMPQGRSTVERLIDGPDGYKLLEYMATAKGGHELAKMLDHGSGARGKNLEAPTGRIYDEAQLIAALETLRLAAAKKSAFPNP